MFENQVNSQINQNKKKEIQIEDKFGNLRVSKKLTRRKSTIGYLLLKTLTNENIVTMKTTSDEKSEFSRKLKPYINSNLKYIIIGYLSAIINGATYPFIGYFFAQIISVLAFPSAPDFREKADFYSGMFMVLATVSFLSNVLQYYYLEVAGQNMIVSIRSNLFSKIMNMPIEFFDSNDNSPAALASLLSTDTTYLYKVTAFTQGIIILVISSTITSIIIAFTSSWQLTLLSIVLSPLLFISAKFQAAFSEGFSNDFDELLKKANEIIFEGITNIRTVCYLTADELILKQFKKKFEKPNKKIRQIGIFAGIFFGISNFLIYGIYAILFYVGAVLMRDEGLSFQNLYITVFTLMYAAFETGFAAQLMPDVGKGIAAAKRIFSILDSENEFEEELRINPNSLKNIDWGNIEFSNVSFAYPTRTDKMVLKNISFTIKYGEKVAFVGPSGSGKSTILQLLQRFYDFQEGSIRIHGVDIRMFEKKALRAQYGVVSQEPVLFNDTIKYNIKYNTANATEEDVTNAAEMANALEFILNDESFYFIILDFGDQNGDHGFDRKVGLKGGNISGGQKQRLAIARALLKNPTVLLLDEATSALDSKSEHAVQQTLDKLMENKTTIIVAHRISTIKNADRIFVLDNGEIVEQGNYNELVAKQGVFYRLERGIKA